MEQYNKVDPEEIILELKKLIEILANKNKTHEKNISNTPTN